MSLEFYYKHDQHTYGQYVILNDYEYAYIELHEGYDRCHYSIDLVSDTEAVAQVRTYQPSSRVAFEKLLAEVKANILLELP